MTRAPNSSAPRLPLPAAAAMHIVAVGLVNSTWMASQFILPVIARREFGANDVQTLLITATPTIFFLFSIFWNDLFRRTSFARYLLYYWLVACFPLVFMSQATNYWMILVPHLIACIGGAGYHPAAGDLLGHLYPAASRGRWYSLVASTSMAAGALAGFGIGKWMNFDHMAFRWYLPIIAGLQGGGILLMIYLSHLSKHERTVDDKDTRTFYARAVEPVTHMKEVLKSDPVFAQYETAYMVYGIGWMICWALLPMLITDKFKLPYDAATSSTQVPYQIILGLAFWPAGMMMDKLGAIRSTGISFLLLTLYPIGLIFATNASELTLVSGFYGLAHAGASVGWVLGPVALAPTKEKVPQYVAIHATMVGIRGKLFQGLGVLIYSVSHGFVPPLALGAAGFLASAFIMLKLHGKVRRP